MLLFLAAIALAVTVTPAVAAELAVTVTGVSEAPGTVHLRLYRAAERFPDDDGFTAEATRPAAPGALTVRFTDVPEGAAAVMAFHDVDADGEMDRFLGMIPQEGYALSRDPRVMGPPAFDDSAVMVEGDTGITMTMRY